MKAKFVGVQGIHFTNNSGEEVNGTKIYCAFPDENVEGLRTADFRGHIHARMEYNEKNRAEGIRRYDVGVDANNFFPVSVKQIIDFFGEQVYIDDHNIV